MINPRWNLQLLKNFIIDEVKQKINKNVNYVKVKENYFVSYTDTGKYTFQYMEDKEGNLYMHPFKNLTIIRAK